MKNLLELLIVALIVLSSIYFKKIGVTNNLNIEQLRYIQEIQQIFISNIF